MLEPNPHFVKYFEETRKGVEEHLKVQDLLQVVFPTDNHLTCSRVLERT